MGSVRGLIAPGQYTIQSCQRDSSSCELPLAKPLAALEEELVLLHDVKTYVVQSC